MVPFIAWSNGIGRTTAHHALPFDELVVSYEDCDILDPKKITKMLNWHITLIKLAISWTVAVRLGGMYPN